MAIPYATNPEHTASDLHDALVSGVFGAAALLLCDLAPVSRLSGPPATQFVLHQVGVAMPADSLVKQI